MVAGVRQRRGGERLPLGESGELGRDVGELHVACRHHDRRGGEDLARAEGHFEAPARAGHVGDPLALDRDELLLEPAPVADEQVDRNRVVPGEGRDAVGEAVVLQPVAGTRGGNARSARRRLEEHALGHVVAPRVHGFAEDPDAHAPVEEVRRDGQAVGAASDDDRSGGVGRRVHSGPSSVGRLVTEPRSRFVVTFALSAVERMQQFSGPSPHSKPRSA